MSFPGPATQIPFRPCAFRKRNRIGAQYAPKKGTVYREPTPELWSIHFAPMVKRERKEEDCRMANAVYRCPSIPAVVVGLMLIISGWATAADEAPGVWLIGTKEALYILKT